ncbi:MAG: hypothetical protein HYZ50_03090 [Deltaproteobacteria bacterium]|nr:hypothetical protein [Deltaproteobacteria bacterium]
MKSATLVKNMGMSLMVCGIILAHPFSLAAQEATQAQQEKPAGKMGMPGMMGKEHMPGMMAEMQQRHEQMEKMHQEMTQELQKQMTALREHSKAMEGMSDEKQLFGEMKKHQQMTDGLLGTMLEQREKMHARMQAHHQRMHGRMGKEQPAEGSGTEPSGEHEQHHGK